MNQSVDGDGVGSLLSPADTHQVIHTGRPEHPAAWPPFHPRSRSWWPASALGTRGEGAEFTGCGSQGPRSRVRGWAPGSGGCRGPRGPGEGIPPPRSRRAPRMDAAPRLPWLRTASASPDSRRNLSAKSGGKSQRQIRSPPRVCRSAGPRELRVGARGAGEASEGGGVRSGGCQLRRPLPAGSEGAQRAAPPPRSVLGLAIRPLYSSPWGAGRGGSVGWDGERPNCFLGDVVLFS